jgi:hypothetical protein
LIPGKGVTVEPLQDLNSTDTVSIMSDYDQEQLDALRRVRCHLASFSIPQRRFLEDLVGPYMEFRSEVDRFLSSRFSAICTETCFRSRLSACCTREGILVFFADVVINALKASAAELDFMEEILEKGNTGFKCIFLGEKGCLWSCKPIVCEMFICERAREEVFSVDVGAKSLWERLEEKKKSFTWPDKPVLFDEVERFFLSSGSRSPLMYMNFSPGLLRIKRLASAGPGPKR